ncbi:MAG TPA: YihY/virulence factor BrkB family protein [Casimicrobiaceae bacterium]|nr:YihY/virulence factor BrkB family protein [Casimicrobiaceae bacterium]
MAALREYLSIFKQAGNAWVDDRAPTMGAALAFYSAFSLAPLLVIVIALAGTIYGVDAARGAVVGQFGALLGPVGADALEKLLIAAAVERGGLAATVISFVVLFIGATTVLVELEDDLDQIWRAPPREGSGFVALLRARVLSFGLILGIGFLLVVSLLLGSALAAVAQYWRFSVTDAGLIFLIDLVVTIAAFTVLFAMLYKWLPHVRIAWRDVWAGAFLTAVLFNVGRLAIGLYLGNGAINSTYAAAGSFVVLLLWLYYSAQIFLFGAEFTWVHAEHRKRAMSPGGERT